MGRAKTLRNKLNDLSFLASPRNKLLCAFFVLSGLLLFIYVLISLRWRMVHDSADCAYFAFLMDEFRYVPYRDFFSADTPGVFFINLLFVKIAGISDFGFRLADLLYLSAILVTTYYWMKKFGRQVAWCGVLLFGLVYFRYGPAMSFERDYLIILPVILALLVSSFSKISPFAKSALVGFLFGWAFTIKPHAAVAFPLVIGFLLLDKEKSSDIPAGKLPRK